MSTKIESDERGRRLSVQTFWPLIPAAYLTYISVTGGDRAPWLRWVYGALAIALVTGVVVTAVNEKRAASRDRGAEAQRLEPRRDLL